MSISNRNKLVIAGVAALALMACGAGFGYSQYKAFTGPVTVKQPLPFSHKNHMDEKLGLECAACHKGVETGAHAGIAVRVSAYPAVVDLCNAFGGALVSTSANRAGEPAARAIAELDPRIVDAVDAIAGGDTGGLQRPTDIRDARTGAVLRL